MGWKDDPIVAAIPLAQQNKTADRPIDRAMAGEAAKNLTNLTQSATASDELSRAAADFMTKNAETNTGGLLGFAPVQALLQKYPDFAQKIGVGNVQNLSAMNADTVQMALAQKPSGQRLTMPETMLYKGAVPTMGTPLTQNIPNARKVYNDNTYKQAHQTFASRWVDRFGNDAGMGQAWNQFASQHFGPDGTYYHNGVGNGAPAPPQVAALVAPGRAGQAAQGARGAPNPGGYDINGNPL